MTRKNSVNEHKRAYKEIERILLENGVIVFSFSRSDGHSVLALYSKVAERLKLPIHTYCHKDPLEIVNWLKGNLSSKEGSPR